MKLADPKLTIIYIIFLGDWLKKFWGPKSKDDRYILLNIHIVIIRFSSWMCVCILCTDNEE